MAELLSYDESRKLKNKKILEEEVDVCIIGCGAGGSVMAYEMSKAGKSVVVLEAGDYWTKKDFNQMEIDMSRELYWEKHQIKTEDSYLGISVAKLVGGGTGVNDGVARRAPADNLDRWVKQGANGYSRDDLDLYYEKVEEIMHVRTYDRSFWNKNNQLFYDGMKTTPWPAEPAPVYIVSCHRSGFCNLGCKYNSKQGTYLTYLPKAIKCGARIYAKTEATNLVLNDKGEAEIVEALSFADTPGYPPTRMKIKAKIILLCAGSIYSSVFLLKNNLANSNGQVGRHLATHLSTVFLGIHDYDVLAYRGTPVLSSRNLPYEDYNLMFEANFTYPMELAEIIPGWGESHKEIMKKYNRMQGIYVTVAEDEMNGYIEYDEENESPRIFKPVTENDTKQIDKGREIIQEVYSSLGVSEIYETTKVTAHPECSNRMGRDPKESVVNLHCESHEIPRLFIADAGVFPWPVAVDPSLTVMAVAHKTADYLNDDPKGYFT
jgi:choline dehydrogenase-like flavoprotein